MKPSDVDLRGRPYPLVDTFGRVEYETAVALVVRALATHHDEWEPITPNAVIDSWKRDITAGVEPWSGMARNPFGAPDPIGCVKHRFLSDAIIRGERAWEVSERARAILHTRCRAPRKCPKCDTLSDCTLWTRHHGEWLYAIGASDHAEAIYGCPVHGEWGLTSTGVAFDTPEMWMVSPDGERLVFR